MDGPEPVVTITRVPIAYVQSLTSLFSPRPTYDNIMIYSRHTSWALERVTEVFIREVGGTRVGYDGGCHVLYE